MTRDYLLAPGTPWSPDERPSVHDIMRRHEVDVARAQLLGRTRRASVVAARRRAWLECWEAGHTISAIARAFRRDRATVLYGLRKMGVA